MRAENWEYNEESLMDLKKESLVLGIFPFIIIGIIFNIIYIFNLYSLGIIVRFEIIIGFLLTGIYFGTISGTYHYFRHVYEKNSMKSALMIGSIVFSLVGFYENFIYLLYILLVGINISITVITGFILCGIFFGFFIGLKIRFIPHLEDDYQFFSIRNAMIGSFTIFNFFSLYCNTIYILYTNISRFNIQIDIIIGLFITGIYFGLISGIIFYLSPRFKDRKHRFTFNNAILVSLIIFSYFGLYCNSLYLININLVGNIFKIERIFGFLISGTYFGLISGILFKYSPRFKHDDFNISFLGSIIISSIIFLSISFYGPLMLVLYNFSIGHSTSSYDIMGYIIIGGILGFFSLLLCNMPKEED